MRSATPAAARAARTPAGACPLAWWDDSDDGEDQQQGEAGSNLLNETGATLLNETGTPLQNNP